MSDSIDTRRKIYCVRHGHSRVVNQILFLHYCARCDEEVGDLFSGFYSGKTAVAVGHNCNICISNASTLTKEDLAMLPAEATEYVDMLLSRTDPFPDKNSRDKQGTASKSLLFSQ